MTSADGFQRLDRWLWGTRLYKTRADAQRAIAGGQVQLNDARVKPAHVVRPADVLSMTREQKRTRVTVLAIPTRRGPASEAALCYRLEVLFDPKAVGAAFMAPAPGGRPDKQGRRRLRELKGRY